LTAPISEKEPVSQRPHDFKPDEFPNVPDGHGEQDVEPAKAYEPGRQNPEQIFDV
jgi:hypothetical protein